MAIVNGGDEADTLVAIDGEGFGDVEIDELGQRRGAAPPARERDRDPGPVRRVRRRGRSPSPSPTSTSLTTGQYLELTLTFENAGEVTLPVTVANPEESERGEAFDFHRGRRGRRGRTG